MKNFNLSRKIFRFFPLLILSLFTLTLSAQQPDASERNKMRTDSMLKTAKLDKIPGRSPVFYTPGHKERAIAIKHFIDACASFYEKLYPGKKFAVNIYILDNRDWQKAATLAPYGIPFYSKTYNTLVISADKNALANLEHLPVDSSSDRAVSGYDFLAIHELGHYFFLTLNHTQIRQHWFDEFLADYFLLYYVKVNALTNNIENDPARLRPMKYRNLDDFEKLYPYLGMGPQNYDWYQRKFGQLALSLYPDLKVKLITKILAAYSRQGKPVDGFAFLQHIAPIKFNEWLSGMK